ncbi:MAG TPA: calcium/sodium antiporter [Cyclobacteriaceae bacterium]|nr:calcium/sodium antiporter [Cyclobacteriaceae bacterium]
MFLIFLLLLVGFVILIKGADFLVNGAASVAKKYNISNLTIGLTVVAFGTSTPELLVNIMSSVKGYNDAAFGNVIGSNILNLLFILGVSGLIYPLVVQRNTVSFEVPLSLIAVVVLFILVNDTMIWNGSENILSRIDGLILLILFGLFMVYIARTMNNGLDDDEGTPVKLYSVWVSVLFIVLGLALLIGGGSLVVDNAVAIARHYGLSEKLIGLTILAAGTSLPELATSAVAAYRKNTDIAIGNVVGSCIFNIFLILGITGMIRPTPYNTIMNFDMYVLGASTILLMIFMFTLNQRKLDRWEALIMLLSYFTYAIVLVGLE